MSSHDAGDWVRQGTPRGADWEDEQSEYGTALDPTEWDDHVAEQSVPVDTPTPRPRPAARAAAGPQGFTSASQPETPGAREEREGTARTEPVTSHAPDVSFRPAASPTPTLQDEGDAADEPTVVSGLRMPEPRDPGLVPPPPPSFVSKPAGMEDQDEETTARPLDMPHPVEQAFPQRSAPMPPQDSEVGQEEAASTIAWPLDTSELSPAQQTPQPAPQKREPTLKQRLEGQVGEDFPSRSADTPRPRPEQVPPQYPDPTSTQRFERVPSQPEPAPAQPVPQQETTAVSPGLFRGDAANEPETSDTAPHPEATSVMQPPAQDTVPAQVASPIPVAEQEEERRRREKLEAERAARNERLGVVATSSENASRPLVEKPRPTTDRPLASFGLFFLRLVSAAILVILAYQGLTNVDGTAEALSRTHLPEPRLMVWVGGFLLAAMAFLLVIGLLQRVVGVLLLVMAICSLAFIRWGAFSPFLPGLDGFLGDRDLLLGAVGLLLICLGGGGWGIDAAFRRSREASREDRDG
jgi:hypothetical protein